VVSTVKLPAAVKVLPAVRLLVDIMNCQPAEPAPFNSVPPTKANGIEVVKNLGSVVLDLSQQNVLQRGLGGNSVLVRPLPLHSLVVAAGEE